MKTRFEVGQEVLYKGCWGKLKAVKVTITGIGTHHNKRVYDTNTNHFGYESQFEAISK